MRIPRVMWMLSLALIATCLIAQCAAADSMEPRLALLQSSLTSAGINIDPTPYISNFTKDFPYKFMIQAPCADLTVCGDCRKMEVWFTFKNINLNYEIEVYCLKCSSGYPKMGAVSTSGSPTLMPTSFDISEMCVWYSKAMVYSFWIFMGVCVFTITACCCCRKSKPAKLADDYFAYKAPESVSAPSIASGTSVATLSPALGAKEGPGQYTYQPQQAQNNSAGIYANTASPPYRYGGNEGVAPVYPPPGFTSPAQHTYDAAMRRNN